MLQTSAMEMEDVAKTHGLEEGDKNACPQIGLRQSLDLLLRECHKMN